MRVPGGASQALLTASFHGSGCHRKPTSAPTGFSLCTNHTARVRCSDGDVTEGPEPGAFWAGTFCAASDAASATTDSRWMECMARHSAEPHGCHGAGWAARANVRLAVASPRDYVRGMASVKTWRQKLETDHDLPKVEKIPARMAKLWGVGTIVIAAPREVDALMARVPKGKVTTIDELRAALAHRHGATIACPMTTGIFANIAARAADEAEQAGRRRITPYWRTLKARGEVNPKFPGGLPVLRSRLEAEGHTVIARGARLFVAEYTARLVRPKAE